MYKLLTHILYSIVQVFFALPQFLINNKTIKELSMSEQTTKRSQVDYHW